jgi:hypothetical protein
VAKLQKLIEEVGQMGMTQPEAPQGPIDVGGPVDTEGSEVSGNVITPPGSVPAHSIPAPA